MSGTSNSLKSVLGRALRETGAALKESGNAEVRKRGGETAPAKRI